MQQTSRLYVGEWVRAMTLPLMLFGVAPWVMYLGNRDEYASASTVLSAMLLMFAAASAALFLLLRLVRGRQAQVWLSGILVGLALAVWVQTQFFAWDFGVLDGRGLDWNKFHGHALAEVAVWALIGAMVLLAALRRPYVFRNLARIVPVLGLVSLLISSAANPAAVGGALRGEFKPAEQAFAFHPQRNTIVILLDTFQSDAFSEILQQHPAEVAFLKGFRFFPDTVGGYPTTKHAVPQILAGRFYKNDLPYTRQNREALTRGWIVDHYLARDFGVTGDLLLTRPDTERRLVISPALRGFRYLGLSSGQIHAIDVGLFRALPTFLKRRVYDEGRWWLTSVASDPGSPPPPHGDDWRVVQRLLQHANVKSAQQGEFKFLHLLGAHYPISLDHQYQRVAGRPNTRGAYVDQARGVLKLTRSVLDKLKALGVYDSAEILILADHGTHDKVPADMRGTAGQPLVNPAHIGSARPLLLYKAAGSTAPLAIDNTAMHLVWMPCLLSGSAAPACTDLRRAQAGQPVVREHYRYEWRHEFWYTDFSPPMSLYEVHGDARDYGSWRNTGIVFKEGKVDSPRAYRLGQRIGFGEGGGAAPYLASGWSGQEKEHRWSEGKQAMLALRIEELPPGKALALAATGFGFSPDGRNPQPVHVSVNGRRVATWAALPAQPFTAQIPADVAAKSLNITFDIEHPTAPCGASKTGDCRLLGFGLQHLALTVAP